MRQSKLLLDIVIVALYFLSSRGFTIEVLEENVPPFSAEDCARITANGTCHCLRDIYNSTEIKCATSSVNISVTNENGVEINCGSDFQMKTVTNLPQLGRLRETRYTATYKCTHITELLAQMALTPRSTLYVHGLKMPQITLELFGRQLNRLRGVTILDLRADTIPPQLGELKLMRQQLSSDILTAMSKLFRLTIDLNFTELPTDLFKPVPNINDISLYGELFTFPSDAFQYLRRLRELSLQRHHFEHRLGENIFQNLTTIRGLYMTNCSITVLPAHIFTPLRTLRYLNLMDNKLSELPPQLLARQQSLKALNFNGNRIQATPLGFFNVYNF